MPLYEYQCGSCGSVFEVRQKFSDEPLTVHENCGGAVRRLLTAPALQFKGSGWYITDYARAGSSGSGKAEKGDSKPAESKSDSKTDSGKTSTSSDTASSTSSSSATPKS